MSRLTQLATAVALVLALPAFAQTATTTPATPTTNTETQRDLNQQERIDQGLQSGQLSTKEAGQLERGEAAIDRTQSRADRDGTLSPAEAKRVQRMQNRESRRIAADKSNAVTGNPNSASSKRLQADVGRQVNQDKRIQQGEQSGQLTNKETGRLERRQARIAQREANAGANGHVSAAEQGRVQHAENRSSAAIYTDKTNTAVQ